MWKTLNSKKIFEHSRLTLIEDDIQLPNGTKSKYLLFEDKGDCVTIICRNEEGKINLQKEFSYPIRKSLYQFPGGFVPCGENIEDGANRELMEELGYKSNKLTQIGKYLMNNRRSKSFMYVFLAEDLEVADLKGNRDATEEDLLNHWVQENIIDKKIKSGEIIHVHVLASWGFYKNLKIEY
ncbi:MAG: NUDIX hydrolase [Candidatus Moranbacteria bacterium]|nr:NUDIX hydrolase [Candidatus Moranbacteria bacterium]